MTDNVARIAENVAAVRRRIAEAAVRSGRGPDAVTLVAVSKYVDVNEVRSLVAAGCSVLGESRPQELWRKAETLAEEPITWHMLGHLQRNKVRRTLPLVAMIESVDSERLLAAIDAASCEAECRTPVLLEVNVSGEEAKTGLMPDAVRAMIHTLPQYEHVEVRGLMAMASLAGGLDTARANFAAARRLRDELRDRCPPGHELSELSMGMTRDFDVAIEEGATIVRIGSALFEGIL